MKKSIGCVSLLSLILITVPSFVYAVSIDNVFGMAIPSNIVCNTVISQNLKLYHDNPAVATLQKILNISPETRVSETGAGSPGQESTYFGPKTHKAVVKFQEKYSGEVLAPAGLSKGSGYVGENTRKKIADICDTLSSGMSNGDLVTAALLGFNKVFYKNLKSFNSFWKNTSKSTSSGSAPSNTNSSGTSSGSGTSSNTNTPSQSSGGGSSSSNTQTPTTPTTPTVPSTPPANNTSSTYPIHTGITAAVFWVGEPVGNGSSEDNGLSAWDDEWQKNFGGFDDPENRNGYFPVGFTPKENPFYLDLPYNDFNDNGTRKSNASTVVPWAKEKTWGSRESMMKNRWVKLTRNNATCYGQIEDAGPYQYDDYAYVFGTNDARPKSKIANNAGMDVSPAIRDCLKFNGTNNVDNKVDWQFVNAGDVPDGPWKQIVTTSQINWP